MKAKSTRLIISTLIAAATISMTAVSAAAVDYSADGAPKDDAPSSPSIITDDDIYGAVENSSENGTYEVSVPMNEDTNGNAVVQEAAIAEIARNDIKVTVEVNDRNGHDYSVTIDPDMIKEAKAINIAMDIGITDDETPIADDITVPSGSIIINPAQKGDFGMTLKVTLSREDTADIDPEKAMLFYVGDDGTITQQPEGSLVVNSDGSISILISHASGYIITDRDILADSFDDEDDTFDNDEEDIDYADNDDSENAIIIDDSEDVNPSTGAALATGAAAAAAAAVLVTAKRKKR